MDATENEAHTGPASRLSWRMPQLDRYVLSRFVGIYGASLLSFTLLFVLIDLVNNIDQFNKQSVGFVDLVDACVLYYTSIVPVVFCQILGPVVCLASALFTVTIFQRSNEFVPMLASGRSHQRTLMPILVASAVLSVGTFVIQEAWIPRTADSIRESIERKGRRPTYEGIKYRDSEHGNLIVLPSYNRIHQRTQGVLVVPIWKTGKRQYLINAESMEWRKSEAEGDDYWLLRECRLQEYDSTGQLVPFESEGPEGTAPKLVQFFAERKLETSLTPEYIELLKEESVYLSLADLGRRVADSPDASRWIIKYMARFSGPATSFILVLLGLPALISFGSRNIFVGALVAICVAAVFFFVHSALQEFGVRGHLPARVGAWIGPVLFTALGCTLYRGMET